ncbi:terpene synthase family protein [Aspergillus alliaceus]|uniref:terpene synthase family protein n=1 Tax=Petromyces alliaceus TaxID=209559 RepID=UPI0012A3B712|nr:terpene synthase metal binding domain protein [Aspergillus alliaceus]KAB8236095.1 terpene synthase metal binding domain protein [Aspergillus alliaceus]
MFVLFLSEKPVTNVHYETVKVESESWISRICAFGDRKRRVITETDFSYFCSIVVPDALPSELRTVFDWGNWVFPFDDMFDNGGLKDDPVQAQQLVNSLLAGMRNDGAASDNNEDNPLVHVHNSVWHRLTRASPIGVQRRFAKAMRDYCSGAIEQVHNCSRDEYPTLDEMLALRRRSSGVLPLFALVEYAHKLDIPDSVFKTRSVQEIERIGIDLVLLQNDILSYCKEEKEGVAHNMIAICRRAGMPAQMAFDHIGDMLLTRYRDWYLALADLPSWGEGIDSEVQQYIRGVQNVVRANLHWSFRSGRYFGEANEEVRKSGIVTVQRQSADVELSIL